jgi:hypothetical protein
MKRLVPLPLCCLFALGACHAGADVGVALADLAQPGASVRITLDRVQSGATAEAVQPGSLQRRYAFQPAAQPQLAIVPARGMWNGSGQGELRLQAQNAMPWALTLLIDIDGAAAGQHLHAVIALPAGPPQIVVIPLRARSPRDFGMQAGPPMPFEEHGRRMLLATTVTGTLDPHRIRAIRLGIPSPQAAQTLLLGKVALTPGESTLHAAYTDLVDRYGQSTRGRWPEKIDNDASLRAAVNASSASSASSGDPASLDKYGGRLDVQTKTTGWFHALKANGRWQLVTPDGHPFFSLGVNAVAADGGRSYVEGREWLFRDLPPMKAPWQAFYGEGDSRQPDASSRSGIRYDHGRWFDFYGANLYRVDGDHALQAWRARALGRLRDWGFNTIGNWSDPALAVAHRLPYTRSINIAGDYANVSSGYDYWGRMPDPFDPRFVQATKAAVAKATSGVRDDPWLLGYSADNELAWAGTGPQGRWGLAIGSLRGDARSPAKQAFIALLKKKYVDPIALGAAWGIALSDWASLDITGFAAPVPTEAHPAIADDYSAWLRAYAEAYFRTVAEAIHRRDPHHLFLGGRFAVRTPEAVAACARYCDVLSFNVYADLPQHGLDLAALHALDRPLLISEFNFGSDDRGPFGKGVVPVWNEGERGPAYARFVAAAASDPAIVGAHWFQYTDQPAAGRLLDGENSHMGLVGITDIPFAGFVEAVRTANARATGPVEPLQTP